MQFYNKLQRAVQKTHSFVCVGLDSDINRIPDCIEGNTGERIALFNQAIIESTQLYCAAYKFNIAFFEALGMTGLEALEKSLPYVPESHVLILDAKRGDIGNTSQQYSSALFDVMKADAVTVNPYMGYDSILPFIEREDKGAYILCLTSNKGSEDFQQLKLESGKRLFQEVAEKITKWNTRNNLGMVVGATHPDELKTVRTIASDMPFLLPGIGAQKGDLESVVSTAIGKKRIPTLINSSRGIIFASGGENFAKKAVQKCIELRDSINNLLE